MMTSCDEKTLIIFNEKKQCIVNEVNEYTANQIPGLLKSGLFMYYASIARTVLPDSLLPKVYIY